MNKHGFLYDAVPAQNIRKNVILMGDIIADTFMARKSEHDTILKIGFLNDMENNGHLFNDYLQAFDLVIANDGPLLPVNMLLEHLLHEDFADNNEYAQHQQMSALKKLLK
jgi:hypothetical protein